MITLDVFLSYDSGSMTITTTEFKGLLDLLSKISTDKIQFRFSSSSIATLKIVPDERQMPKRARDGKFLPRVFLDGKVISKRTKK